MMLGLLLARAGVPVTVLEKHKDFFRDFRGDTIHPSTMELLHELGLLEKFLTIPHAQMTSFSINIGGEQFMGPDFTHLPTQSRFTALMPQWDFLDFLAAEAKQYPTFTLLMEHEATGLLTFRSRQGLCICGVHANSPTGPVDIPATLVVGCDGRHATSVAASHLHTIEDGVPIDVLWFRIPRQPSDPENGLGYINFGHMMVLLNRNDYFQTAFLIPKGTYPALKQRGLDQFHKDIESVAPFLAGRTSQVDSFDKVKLLTVQVNHLERWALPGLLCIGDAAHAMSPVGGIGINIALQDAVATANRLTESLLDGQPTLHDLLAVQHYRERAVRNTQRFQIFAHRILNRVLSNPAPVKPPWQIRLLLNIPGIHGLIGRFIGMGLQPQHIHTPEI
jgi:2-polyprenyl-6-methoxyphenol hydroxylase-like FAD-dependent oxidoreductase